MEDWGWCKLIPVRLFCFFNNYDAYLIKLFKGDNRALSNPDKMQYIFRWTKVEKSDFVILLKNMTESWCFEEK